MGKRKVTILETAAESVAKIAIFIESKGIPQTAKKYVDEIFEYFDTLADEKLLHKPCNYNNVWKYLEYRCVTYKKFVVAYLSHPDEIIICDFVASKLLK